MREDCKNPSHINCNAFTHSIPENTLHEWESIFNLIMINKKREVSISFWVGIFVGSFATLITSVLFGGLAIMR